MRLWSVGRDQDESDGQWTWEDAPKMFEDKQVDGSEKGEGSTVQKKLRTNLEVSRSIEGIIP